MMTKISALPLPAQPALFARLAGLLAPVARPRQKPDLDPRSLSDHLKRDLGFLDGNVTVRRG